MKSAYSWRNQSNTRQLKSAHAIQPLLLIFSPHDHCLKLPTTSTVSHTYLFSVHVWIEQHWVD
ncbi:hypothetical protein MUCCIDRAFT_178685 [Mucor lusitanicus CBS 277.49]|uniref:Uncharacterized protein n=1 Tax=Mucor lusitanicus CBS 277.49 TaxID=747725 RepID=A0A168LDM5_MUCCL|nr:hypothetical protein MUCCIDRAFT_178685 [Mucor lusitanicus CBS 277.49]